uniref:Uncharacterized protein n=1 Tax=Arundo donax TaxID=35708 RepID=A0A0A9G1B1_ARUDO
MSGDYHLNYWLNKSTTSSSRFLSFSFQLVI